MPQNGKALRDRQVLNPTVAANQVVQLPPPASGIDWYYFLKGSGVEKLWIISAAQPIPALDAIFNDAAWNNQGVISGSDQIARLQAYFKEYDMARPDVSADKAKELTSVKAHGEILVNRVELTRKD